jgi:hypothetical protein
VKARVGGEKSSVEQIKEKWRKACSTAKLEVAVNRKSLNQTGGGPALPAPSGVTQKNLGTSHRCTKDISEEERDSLIHFLCTFQEINMSVMDIPSMVHDSISFILIHIRLRSLQSNHIA